MDLINWIIVGIMGASVLVVVGIVLSKWKKLVRIDVAHMPDVQLRAKKYKLIEQRLQRKVQARGNTISGAFRAIGDVFVGMFKTMFDHLVELERKYRMAALSDQSEEGKEKTRQKIAGLLEEGNRLFKEGNIVEAENMLVDVIRLQPQEKEAYSLLAQVYMDKKEYENAIETLKHLRKLDEENEQVHYSLGVAYEEYDEIEKAVESYQTAVELAPKNPRNLDTLINAAIAVEDRFLARDALRRLKEADPDNKKLTELEKKIDEL